MSEMKTIVIGASDEDADWLKYIGNNKQEDIEATEAALKKPRKRGKLADLITNLRKGQNQ